MKYRGHTHLMVALEEGRTEIAKSLLRHRVFIVPEQVLISAHACEGYSSRCVCQCVTLATSTRWQAFSIGNLHRHEECNILFGLMILIFDSASKKN